MRKKNDWCFLICAIVFSSVFISSISIAHEKVVVVPLGEEPSDPNLLAENICLGVSIFEVSGKKTCDRNVYGTVTSAGGRTWLDRNLGATRVATSPTDSLSYGDLYQWGRLADHHESRYSQTSTTVSSTSFPGHGAFIIDNPLGDWLDPQNINLWQGKSGTNNPCPANFKVPTDAEWEIERASWSSNNAAGAFASPLKLVVAGARSRSSGTINDAGSHGRYWSSTVNVIYSRYLYFGSDTADMLRNYRAYGFTVRCLKE